MHQSTKAPVTAEQMDHIFGASFVGVAVHRGLSVLYGNRRMARLLQYAKPAALMTYGSLDRHIPARNHKRLLERWAHIMDGTLPPERNRIRYIALGGAEIWVDVTDEPIFWQDGQVAILSTITDVSSAVQANESLLSSLRRLEVSLDSILETIPTGVAIFSDNNRPRMVNSAMRALFQDDPHPNNDVPAVMADLITKMARSDLREVSARAVTTPMGRVVDLIARRMDDDAVMMCASDVSDWQAQQDKLRNLAEHDMLTGLYNRRGFTETVRPALKQAADDHSPCALITIDIDYFKQINDRHGHAAGDAALRSIAKRLAKELRDGDLIGRIGGEEFAIFLAHTDAETAERIAERLRAKVAAHPFAIKEGSVPVTASFGLKTWEGRDPAKLRTLMQDADGALYRAKQLGRNRVVVA